MLSRRTIIGDQFQDDGPALLVVKAIALKTGRCALWARHWQQVCGIAKKLIVF